MFFRKSCHVIHNFSNNPSNSRPCLTDCSVGAKFVVCLMLLGPATKEHAGQSTAFFIAIQQGACRSGVQLSL